MKIKIEGRVFDGELGELISNDNEFKSMLKEVYDSIPDDVDEREL